MEPESCLSNSRFFLSIDLACLDVDFAAFYSPGAFFLLFGFSWPLVFSDLVELHFRKEIWEDREESVRTKLLVLQESL